MSAQYVGPAPAAAQPPRRTVVWYYRDAEVAVTNHYFHRGVERYPIADLGDLGTARGPSHPAVLVSAVIAVAQVPVLVTVAMMRSPVAFAVAAVLLVVSCGVAAVSAVRRPPTRHLLAFYRGHELTLYSTPNARAFGQVARALQRAVEALPLS